MLRAVESTCRSDTGLQRKENEDNAYALAPLFVVADGMGGAQAGEVASRIAVEAFQDGLSPDGSPEERLAERVRAANRQIYERSRTETGREGMGTTLTAAYLDDAQLAIAHVGDSRAYLFRDGDLLRLTQDHSLVDELVRRGKLTEEQAAEHPQRSIITRALGPEPEVEVDTLTYPVRAGDVLLLCSDGLTSMLSEEQVAEVLAATSDLGKAAGVLINQANEAGGRDNITVVLFRLEDVSAGPGVAAPADEQTIVGHPAPTLAEPSPRPAVAVAAPEPVVRVRPRPAEPTAPPPGPRPRRSVKPIAALVAVLVVLLLIGGGGYLATRQLYFIGTNSQGIVTIYRGLPYDLPAGIPLYETFFVSGVPASLVPADRRSAFFNNDLRSEGDATRLVRDLELGRVSK
jgi:protein phosphatase